MHARLAHISFCVERPESVLEEPVRVVFLLHFAQSSPILTVAGHDSLCLFVPSEELMELRKGRKEES